MMTDYNSMSDFEINKRVAEILHIDVEETIVIDLGTLRIKKLKSELGTFDPCVDWQEAGDLIKNFGIDLLSHYPEMDKYTATTSAGAYFSGDNCIQYTDRNPMRAICIVILIMNEGKNGN